jgi:hypothetical protein
MTPLQVTDLARIDALLDGVGRAMGATVEEIRGRDRTTRVSAARQAAYWALLRVGLSPAAIARVLDRNHATVVYGLRTAERHLEWHPRLLPAIELSGAGGLQAAVRRWLDHTLRDLAPGELAAVHAYVACTLLGWERRSSTLAGYGLVLVRTRAEVRAAVELALCRCGLEAAVWRVDLHAARLARGA